MSPYFATHGQDASLGLLGEEISKPGKINPPTAIIIKKRFDEIYQMLHIHLQQAQGRYKQAADIHRNESPTYQLGDKVLVSLKNVRTDRPMKKLDYRWMGPYRIKRKINTVT